MGWALNEHTIFSWDHLEVWREHHGMITSIPEPAGVDVIDREWRHLVTIYPPHLDRPIRSWRKLVSKAGADGDRPRESPES